MFKDPLWAERSRKEPLVKSKVEWKLISMVWISFIDSQYVLTPRVFLLFCVSLFHLLLNLHYQKVKFLAFYLQVKKYVSQFFVFNHNEMFKCLDVHAMTEETIVRDCAINLLQIYQFFSSDLLFTFTGILRNNITQSIKLLLYPTW